MTLPLFKNQNNPRVSPDNQPLAKEPEDSGYEIELESTLHFHISIRIQTNYSLTSLRNPFSSLRGLTTLTLEGVLKRATKN